MVPPVNSPPPACPGQTALPVACNLPFKATNSCLSQNQLITLQATAFDNQGNDITASVGPFSWNQGNANVAKLTPIVTVSAYNVPTNQATAAPNTPGQTQVVASASGVSSQPFYLRNLSGAVHRPRTRRKRLPTKQPDQLRSQQRNHGNHHRLRRRRARLHRAQAPADLGLFRTSCAHRRQRHRRMRHRHRDLHHQHPSAGRGGDHRLLHPAGLQRRLPPESQSQRFGALTSRSRFIPSPPFRD